MRTHATANRYVSAATITVRCASAAEKDGKLSEEERSSSAQKYTQQAISYYRQALEMAEKEAATSKDPGTDLALLEARIFSTGCWAGITSVQAIYVPADDLTDPAVAHTFLHLDTSILLSRDRAAQGRYPAVDPLASTSVLLDPIQIGRRHYEIAMRVRQMFERYREVRDMLSILGMEELPPEDQQVVKRARRLERFLTQPLFTTEWFTGQPGRYVPLEDTLAGCEAILGGKFDDVGERQLYMIGAAKEVGQSTASVGR